MMKNSGELTYKEGFPVITGLDFTIGMKRVAMVRWQRFAKAMIVITFVSGILLTR